MNHNRSEPGVSWAAAPRRELLRLAWPIAVSMISYSTMTLTGTFFVAGLGPSALAGVGLGGTVAFLIVVFAFGLLRGVKILVSQARGAGRMDDVQAQIATGVVVAAGLGLTGAVLSAGGSLLLPLFADSAESGAAASTYLLLRGLGAPFVLVFIALREARYGAGDARAPMVASVLANGMNIALDALFILVLDFGVAGAALATIIAHATECGVLLFVFRRDLALRRASMAAARRLLQVGVPTGLQFVLEMGSFAILTLLLAKIGDVQLAAHQIALQVIHFSFLPAVAIGEAASVMAGQAIGGKRRGLVLRVAHDGAIVVVLFCGLCTIVLVAFGERIAGAFTDDAVLAATAAKLLSIAALFQVLDGLNIVARGVLRGTGDVRMPALVGVVTAWLCVPPLTLLLGVVMEWGAAGGWIGLTAEIFLATVILWWRLWSKRWLFVARRMQLAGA